MREATYRHTMSGHETFAEATRLRGECDRCHCVAPALYAVGCEDGCYDADDGSWRYCGSCSRVIMARH